MRTTRLPALFLLLALAGAAAAAPACAQATGQADDDAPPPGYGSLRQDDLALRVRNAEIEVRVVPLDLRVTRLLARDSYESLNGLVQSRRRAIDSVASAAGISRPGLALVTFFGQQPGARYDPQNLSLLVRNRVYRPLGIVPFTPRFTSQQLEVREQVSAIYLFEESLPVTDDFSLSYAGLSSENWSRKQPTLDRERARVASRARVQRADSTPR
jgi:hypothetical protein